MWNAVSENDKDDMEFTKYLIASNAHHVLKKGGVMLNADMEERRSEAAEAVPSEGGKAETDKAETDKVEMVKNMENKIVGDVEAKTRTQRPGSSRTRKNILARSGNGSKRTESSSRAGRQPSARTSDSCSLTRIRPWMRSM